MCLLWSRPAPAVVAWAGRGAINCHTGTTHSGNTTTHIIIHTIDLLSSDASLLMNTFSPIDRTEDWHWLFYSPGSPCHSPRVRVWPGPGGAGAGRAMSEEVVTGHAETRGLLQSGTRPRESDTQTRNTVISQHNSYNGKHASIQSLSVSI